MNTCVHGIPLNNECALCHSTLQTISAKPASLTTLQLTGLERSMLAHVFLMGIGEIQRRRQVPPTHAADWIQPMSAIVNTPFPTQDDNVAMMAITSLLRKLS